jgi:hypothetical protein
MTSMVSRLLIRIWLCHYNDEPTTSIQGWSIPPGFKPVLTTAPSYCRPQANGHIHICILCPKLRHPHFHHTQQGSLHRNICKDQEVICNLFIAVNKRSNFCLVTIYIYIYIYIYIHTHTHTQSKDCYIAISAKTRRSFVIFLLRSIKEAIFVM